MEINQNIKPLIQKFVRNQCSMEEIEELVQYFKNGRISDEFPKTEEVLEMLENVPEMNEEDAQRIYDQIINTYRRNERQIKMSYFYKYAAVAAIIVLIFGGVNYYKSVSLSNNTVEVVSDIPKDAIILEKDSGQNLILSDLDQHNLTDDQGEVIAHHSGNQLIYSNNEQYDGIIKYNTLRIPYGKRFKVQLSDGSSVTLNAGSTLRYPTSFSKVSSREVFLTGEAFFRISEDKERPFRVKTGELEVSVLGTEFNVSAYPEDITSKVILVEGSVQLGLKSFNTTLVPGQLASLKRSDNALEISEVDTGIYTAWMQGNLVFRNMSFEDILKKMERHYNVKIINNNEQIAKDKFNASFDQVPLVNILDYFKGTYGLSYTLKDDKTIIINSKLTK